MSKPKTATWSARRDFTLEQVEQALVEYLERRGDKFLPGKRRLFDRESASSLRPLSGVTLTVEYAESMGKASV